MDARLAQRLYVNHSNAMAFVEIQTPNGDISGGTAFHVGEGIFVTARHIVEGNNITKIEITEPVGISTREYFEEVLKIEVTDEYIREYDNSISSGASPNLWKDWLKPLHLADGPFFAPEPELDVAVFRVREIHPAAGIIKLGVHWDDWIYRGIWHLSDAIILGYPPIPMTNEPVLVAARAEVHTFVVPRHAPAVHFVLSAIPRGGFSGGVALQEDGNALGVVTSSFVQNGLPEQTGFFAVLSVEAIVKCLVANRLYPEIQRQHHQSILEIDPKRIFEGLYPRDRR